VSKAWDPDDIFDVLASEDVRQILVATNVRSMSVKELADICDRSLATIYRRIQAMENYNLVSEEITRDADGTIEDLEQSQKQDDQSDTDS
jgi:transposase